MGESFKRKLVKFTVLPGIVVVLLIWWYETWITKEISIVSRYILPGVAVYYSAIAFLYWKKFIRERTFDIAAFTGISSYFLTEFSIIFVANYSDGSHFGSNFIMWFPLFYLLGFLN